MPEDVDTFVDRRRQLTTVAIVLHQNSRLSKRLIEVALFALNLAACKPPLDDTIVNQIVEVISCTDRAPVVKWSPAALSKRSDKESS